MQIKISREFIIGLIIGGLIGVSYCKSSWPIFPLFIANLILTTVCHSYIVRYWLPSR